MSTDELWALREKISACLAAKLTAEKNALERRLAQLIRGNRQKQSEPSTERRRYPTVVPKFRNPDRPSETWAGRGKQPRWLAEQLRSGKRVDDFRIERAAA
jgi:DNA-binding protein H-NS